MKLIRFHGKLTILREVEVEVQKSVDEDIKIAGSDHEIAVEELFHDMYESNLQGKIQDITPWDKHTLARAH